MYSTSKSPISSVTVGSVNGSAPVTASVVGTSTTVTGLSIVVPSGYQGVNIPVTVNYANVGLNGVPSGGQVFLTLNHVKSVSGGTTTTTNNLNTSSATMILVGTVPTITLTANNSTLTTGTVQLGTVTVQAGPQGNMILNTLPLTIGTNGGATVATSSIVVQVGNSVIATTRTAVSGTETDVNFTGGYTIQANTAVTFAIYATVSGTFQASPGASVTLSLQPSTDFVWTDVVGNASGITGQYINNYPTTNVSMHD